jgi:hypothetical protein
MEGQIRYALQALAGLLMSKEMHTNSYNRYEFEVTKALELHMRLAVKLA